MENKLPSLYFESLYIEDRYTKKLLEGITVVLSNGDVITIPRGYISDGATVPRIFWGVVSPHGRHDLATLIHDYLITDTKYNDLFVDRELLYWLKKCSVHPVKRTLMYYCVRLYRGYLK